MNRSENIVQKEIIARYEKSLTFPTLFQTFENAVLKNDVKKKHLVTSRLKSGYKIAASVKMHLDFDRTVYSIPNKPLFARLQYKSFENTVRKGEIARNEQFLLFPQCFQPF